MDDIAIEMEIFQDIKDLEANRSNGFGGSSQQGKSHIKGNSGQPFEAKNLE